jgi:alkanesulfonate monooxygenase
MYFAPRVTTASVAIIHQNRLQRLDSGRAVVGNPAQCADTLQQFIDAGCHSFCLSGYLHDEEAERFGRLIRPILAENNRGRWAA